MAQFFFEIGSTIINATVSLGEVTIGEAAVTTVGGGATAAASALGLGILGGVAQGTYFVTKKLCNSVFKICPPNLKKYTVNFSDHFRVQRDEGVLFQKAYNRQREVLEIESKLSIPNNSAVFLHGPAGVGKTAIVEQVVYRQVTGQSKALQEYEILKLDHNKLYNLQKGIWTQIQEELFTNGAQGELDKIFDALKGGKYILFIDEAEGVINTQFFQKKLEELARGEVKLIFATTTNQMSNCTSNWGPAMKRRIPLMEIKEFNIDQMIDALKEGKAEYDSIYGVTLDDDALAAVVALSTNVVDERFPHKAVNLLGTICNAIKASSGNGKPHITKKAVIECYALLNAMEAAALEPQVDKMILRLKPEDIAPYFQKIEAVNHKFPVLFTTVLEKARACFTGNFSTILIEPSKTLQTTLMHYFAKERTIIPIHLHQLSTIYSQLSPKNQNTFINYFDELCSSIRPLFYVVDCENYLVLVSEEGKDQQPSRSIASNYQNEINKGVDELEKALDFMQLRAPQVNMLRNLVDFEKVDRNNNKSSNSNSLLEKMRICPFVQNFLAKVHSKEANALVPHHSSNLVLNDGRNSYRFQTIETLRLGQKLDLLKMTYAKIDPEVVSQALACALYFYNIKEALDMASNLLTAVQDDTISKPDDVIKQKLLQLGQDSSAVETVLHKHSIIQLQLTQSKICSPVDVQASSLAVTQVVDALSQAKARMNFLTIDESDRDDFVAKMSNQLPENTHLHYFSTNNLEGCTLSKVFQQELILEKLRELHETLAEHKPKDPVLVINIPFAKLNDNIVAELEKIVTVHGMRAVYFCSKEEIEAPKVQKVEPGSPSMIERIAIVAIGQFMKKEQESAEDPYILPDKLCVESRKILHIDLRQATSLTRRITQFFHNFAHNPLSSVKKGIRMIYDTALISLNSWLAKRA